MLLGKGLVLWIILSIFCMFHVISDNGAMRPRGLIVIPGLGRADRLSTVVHNIKVTLEAPIQPNKIEWDCIVYVYTSRKDEKFWSQKELLGYVSKYCQLIENPGGKVTENLYMLQPSLIHRAYEYIFILLDDIKLNAQQSNTLNTLYDLLQCNKLTVISPLIEGANKVGGMKFRNIMQTKALPHTEGYVSSFVEIFAWLMTYPAYEALWELLCPEINPYAWGYDFWYDQYAKGKVKGHRMGIASNVQVYHDQDMDPNSERGRTDNTKVSVKWNAVVAQERHYEKYKNIPLGYYRKHMDLANSSWNGAVKGYLQSCP